MSRSARSFAYGILTLGLALILVGQAVAASAATAGQSSASRPVAGMAPDCISDGAGHCYVPPPCRGATCVGQDPQALGCGGANGSSLDSATAPGGGATITLRGSDWCQANWADIDMGWGDDWYVQTADGRIERWSGDGSWTFMVDGTQLARACIQGYGHANYACTAWH